MLTTHTSKTLSGCLMLLASLVFATPALAMNDPVTGRWLTRDPKDYNNRYLAPAAPHGSLRADMALPAKERAMRLSQGSIVPRASEPVQIYEYLNSNPLQWFDPSGLHEDADLEACYAEADADQKDCEDLVKSYTAKAKAAATSARTACYAGCAKLCKPALADWACRRACDAGYAITYAGIRAAEGGALLGCLIKNGGRRHSCKTLHDFVKHGIVPGRGPGPKF